MSLGCDICLVNAPSRLAVYGAALASDLAAIENPVWLGLIADYLTRAGLRVEVVDGEALGYDAAATAAAVMATRPRLAAFVVHGQQPSASTQCMPGAIDVAARVKSMGVPTAALGGHPSALPDRTLEDGFDYVVRGEGAAGLLRMPGLLISAPRGIVNTPNSSNLDVDYPRQALEKLHIRRGRAHNWHVFGRLGTRNSYASVQTSLGCGMGCDFCMIDDIFGHAPMRFWSPDVVIAQIDELVGTYGIQNIKIPDEMFCLNKKHVNAICDLLIDRGYGLNFWAYARIDTVKDDAMLAKMKRAGFNWLGLGIESGSKHVRAGMKKGRFGNEDIIAACDRVKGHGIAVGANYIVGLPDDTAESMAETYALSREINAPWANWYCAQAYPGSALHRMAQGRGILPEDPGGPGWIGYSQHAPESHPMPTETLTREQVLDFRDEAFLRYFSDPSYLSMMRREFDQETVDHIKSMCELGKPKRKHRDATP